MTKLKEALSVVLAALLIVIAVLLIFILVKANRQIDRLFDESLATAGALRQAAEKLPPALDSVKAAAVEAENAGAALSGYATYQTQVLQSEYYQRLIKASLSLGAGARGTLNLFTTTTLPAINDAVRSVKGSADQLTALTVNLDHEVNGRLLPATAVNLERTFAGVNGSLANLDSLLTDPEIKAAIQNIAALSAHLEKAGANTELTTLEIQQALSYSPAIMRAAEAYSRRERRFGWAIFVIRAIRAGVLP